MLRWFLCGLLGHRWISKILVSTRDKGLLYYERWCYFQSPFCIRCGKINPNYSSEEEGEDCEV
jgi:hypothetical protein